MKYFKTILFIILFTCVNIYAQEQDSTEKTIEESSVIPGIEEEKSNANNEEISLDQQDEKDNIPLEYVIPAYDKFSGFTVGWSINQPVYSGQRFELEIYKPEEISSIELPTGSPLCINLDKGKLVDFFYLD